MRSCARGDDSHDHRRRHPRRRRGHAVAVFLATVALLGLPPSTAGAAVSGSACAKPGVVSGTLRCVVKAGKLRWQPITQLKPQIVTLELPATLLQADGPVTVVASATSRLPVSVNSLTPDTCIVDQSRLIPKAPGRCTVSGSQPGNAGFSAAKASRSVDILGTRSTVDQPDLLSGYQIHAVYVVPSDGADNKFDINGRISRILSDGNELLAKNLDRRVRIDLSSLGYDITYLRTSLTTKQVVDTNTLAVPLMQELHVWDSPGMNRKEWVFFIDVSALNGGEACGGAWFNWMTAVVAVNGVCGISLHELKYRAGADWVHEWFHSLGVEHVNVGVCDLMGCEDGSKPVTFDLEHKLYVGASAAGADVTKVDVWEGSPDSGNLGCVRDPGTRTDGYSFAYCSTGMQRIGAFKSCWSSLSAPLLQEMVGQYWVTRATGTARSYPWDAEDWGCSNSYVMPSALITVSDPGVRHYRWASGSRTLEEFNIVWARQ